MPVYMVERELPGIRLDQLAEAQRTAIATSQRFTSEGQEVRYIRSTFVPGESRCLCLFEAPTPHLVREVNEAADLPFSRIVEALDLTPVLAALVLLASLALSACGGNPAAPTVTGAGVARASSASAGRTTTAAGRSASCSNIDATVSATLTGTTASGTISGDINGPVSAQIHQIDTSGEGALHLLMEHHYTNTSPFGRIDTSDHAVLAPMDKDAGIYRMNNRLTIVGGAGIYANASGELHTHGTVNFTSGAIELSLNGRVCAGL